MAPLLGCSESGRVNWGEKPLFLVGCGAVLSWLIFGPSLVPWGLWGPTAGRDVRVGFAVLAQGEVLRMEGARFGVPPAWGGRGVPGSPIAGVLCFGNVCVEGEAVVLWGWEHVYGECGKAGMH